MYATDTLMDEREVVLRLIDGDEEYLLRTLCPYKNRFALLRPEIRQVIEFAEDIFQDTFTVVWQTIVSSIPKPLFLPIFILLCVIVF